MGRNFAATIVFHALKGWFQTRRTRPLSVCSDSCQAGYQKIKRDGEKFCCFDCVPCPEGMVSNQKDADDCFHCPEDQYPSKNKDQCIPKVITFLSYQEPLGITLASTAASFSLITILVLGIFIKHNDTPIIKANNREFSYILLISLLLGFLLSFLYLGQPTRMACYLQQNAVGMILTLAISCVLAKTLTVLVAFMATKPGSSMKKCLGKRLTTSVVLSSCLIRAVMSVVWLGIYPPFPYLDMQSMTGEIVAKCNKGPIVVLCFHLSHMGFLFIITCTVAFLARNLPDAFTESRFINLSLCMLFSVWLWFVPTLMSTQWKFVVVVENLFILASSAALLGCIFSPKCYIIVLRPKLNSRDQLRRRKKE
ncbi:vomeronasal type-2 receptor 26-like [Hemicordylus capensis]|uniref:vomeronasal type-2 receptor 26-like n=1 Tax=Hemicordylus capensis TaxID=884348 RepID=UPI002303B13B|nr:vomeronasal type-2 receptor 26-like [Hemicordylus capensis]